jgi:electron transport complex protein RnfC
MKAGVDKLQAKYLDAKARYDKAQASLSVTDNAPQLNALSEEITTLSSKVEKAKRALASAEASASPAAEKMKAGVEKLQAKLDELTQSYSDAGGVLARPEPVDPKALKQQVSIMRTKLKKAQAALDDAEEGNLSELTAEVERLTTAHDEAKASLDAYESVQLDKAAAEGIDLKQLKIDAAMARAAVTKAERAAQKAREEKSDDLSDIEQQLIVAQQDAEQLNQTLSRFTD